MVSQQFGRMAPHDDEAEILRGACSSPMAMHREAGEVFAKLIERGAPPPVRDRAWFLHWPRSATSAVFMRSPRTRWPHRESACPANLEEDRALLQANVLMARGKYIEAIAVLEALAKGPGATSYSATTSAWRWYEAVI